MRPLLCTAPSVTFSDTFSDYEIDSDIDSMSSEELPFVHSLAYTGDLVGLKQAIANGADIDTQTAFSGGLGSARLSGVTPLFLAASQGYLQCVIALVEAGAQPNTAALRSGQKCTPAEVAAMGFHFKVASYLRKAAKANQAHRSSFSLTGVRALTESSSAAPTPRTLPSRVCSLRDVHDLPDTTQEALAKQPGCLGVCLGFAARRAAAKERVVTKHLDLSKLEFDMDHDMASPSQPASTPASSAAASRARGFAKPTPSRQALPEEILMETCNPTISNYLQTATSDATEMLSSEPSHLEEIVSVKSVVLDRDSLPTTEAYGAGGDESCGVSVAADDDDDGASSAATVPRKAAVQDTANKLHAVAARSPVMV